MKHDNGGPGIQTGGKFSVVPALAFADRRLKPIDMVVLGVLGITQSCDGVRRREGWFEISQAAIAALSGIQRPTVNKAVARLRKAGYLQQRAQVTATGTRGPSLYALVYDAELPAKFDRWLPVVASDGAIDVPDLAPALDRTMSNVPVGDSSVPTGDSNVTVRPATPPRRGFPTVPLGDTMVLAADSTVCAGHMSPRKSQKITVLSADSGGIESTPFIQEFIESSRAPSAAETIVNAFLRLRRQHYPEAERRPSAREKLLAQAQEFLDLGGALEVIVHTLAQRIQASPAEGLEAPSAIARYRHDLRRAIARDGVALGSRQPADRARRPQAVDDAPWRRIKADMAERLGDERVRAWLDPLAFVGVVEDIVQLGAPTAMIRKFALQVLADGAQGATRYEIAVSPKFSLPRES